VKTEPPNSTKWMCATMKYVSETWMSIGTMPSITPEIPPTTKVTMNPSENSIAVDFKWITPSKSVANQEKILIPVGTAISSVVIIIGTRSQLNMPLTNMWCAHTV
jgi:hypothetical protein